MDLLGPGHANAEILHDGDEIDIGGRLLIVIHTPGHSRGSICFFDADRRQLFIGDLFYYGPLYCENLDHYLVSAE